MTKTPKTQSETSSPAEGEEVLDAKLFDVPDVEITAEMLGLSLPDDPEEARRLLLMELTEARQEAGDLLANLQRVAAEFDNFRKRVERDQVENVVRASQRVIESLLPALDSFRSQHRMLITICSTAWRAHMPSSSTHYGARASSRSRPSGNPSTQLCTKRYRWFRAKETRSLNKNSERGTRFEDG